MSLLLYSLIGESAQRSQGTVARPIATRLETITWQAAESQLRSDSVVVIPLGAASVEHGPHLPLDTDQRLADHLARLALEHLDVVIAPRLAYHYYPPFQEYPGSTSLSLDTARDLTADVARCLARFGPRRFYVLNTSTVTMPALAEAAKLLARDGILLRYTEPHVRLEAAIRGTRPRQPFGNHADEVETSMMLHLDPSLVDMAKARTDLGNESTPFQLTRQQAGRGTYSPTGIWGDATLATPEKGATFVDALVRAIRFDIDDLRRTTPPVGGRTTAAPAPSRPALRGESASAKPGECSGGDERTIRGLGPAFASAWARHDAIGLALLWNTYGDMVHPDGFVEGSAQTILENRTALFARPEYRGSRHGLYIGQIRCVAADIAIADAKWDLRGVSNAKGGILPPVEGLCTLVLKRRDGGWGIEAYRYNLKQTQNMTQPTLLNRPGFADTIK